MADIHKNGLSGLLNLEPQNTLVDYLLRRPEVKGLYYNGQTIRLDGYSWVECRFDNCTLEAISTNFEIKNCIIDPTNSIAYSNNVLKIIQLFCSRYDWAEKYIPKGFLPTKHQNTNGISIQDRP